MPGCCRTRGSSPGSKGSGSALWETGASCATGWCATSSGRTPRTHRVDMRLPTREELRYHGSRWAWVVGLATLAYVVRSEEHTSELQSQSNLVCRLLLEKKKGIPATYPDITDILPNNI